MEFVVGGSSRCKHPSGLCPNGECCYEVEQWNSSSGERNSSISFSCGSSKSFGHRGHLHVRCYGSLHPKGKLSNEISFVFYNSSSTVSWLYLRERFIKSIPLDTRLHLERFIAFSIKTKPSPKKGRSIVWFYQTCGSTDPTHVLFLPSSSHLF